MLTYIWYYQKYHDTKPANADFFFFTQRSPTHSWDLVQYTRNQYFSDYLFISFKKTGVCTFWYTCLSGWIHSAESWQQELNPQDLAWKTWLITKLTTLIFNFPYIHVLPCVQCNLVCCHYKEIASCSVLNSVGYSFSKLL